MIRVVIENILLFLLPTIVYAIYVAVTRDNKHKGLLDEAPLAWLMLAGSGLVLIVLASFAFSSGGRPSQVYVPATTKDGQIQPGHFK
jgi:hypothetical protein